MHLTDEELEIFEIAYCLKLTVAEVMNLDYEEFLGWIDYFKRRPIGWREDNRTSLVMMASGAKIKPLDVFPSLKALSSNNTDESLSDEERKNKSLKGSAFLLKLLSAKGGEKISVE